MTRQKASATTGTITMGIMSPVVPVMWVLPSRRRFQSHVAPDGWRLCNTLVLYPGDRRGWLPVRASQSLRRGGSRAPEVREACRDLYIAYITTAA